MSDKPYPEQPALHSHAPLRGALLSQPSNFQEAMKLVASDPKHAWFGVGQGIPDVFMTKVIASAAPDFIWFDLEHGLWSRDKIHHAIQAAKYHSEGKTMTIVRVTHGDESTLANILDAGVDCVIHPHTETVEEIQAFVKEVYYPPIGQRSYTPWMSAGGVSDKSLYSNDPILTVQANKHIGIMAQVESVKGAENVDDIAALPNVTCLLLGPMDFCLDAGIPMFENGAPHPTLVGAMQKVGAAAIKHGKPALIGMPNMEMLPMLLQLGFRGFVPILDTMFIATSVQKTVTEAREAAAAFSAQSKTQQ